MSKHTFVYLVLAIFKLLLDLLATRSLSDRNKDIEILLLRHQIRILQRKLPNYRPPRISLWEKGVLSVLAVQFTRYSEGTGRRLGQATLLFKPDNTTPMAQGTGTT